MSIRFSALMLLTTLIHVPTAFATPLELPSRVDSVTVFPNGVAVHRTGTTHVEAGTHQIVFGPLPLELSDATIRIGGFGSGVTAQSVSVRVAQRAELLAPRVAQLESALGGVVRRRSALSDRRSSLAHRGGGSTSALRLRAQRLTELDRRLAQLDAQIATRTAALARLRQRGQQRIKLVTVDVDATDAGEMTLSIEYIVPGAGTWRPAYAARLDPATARIGLDVFANVQQRTGENWNDVRVSLSSIVPAAGLELPSLDEWALSLARPDAAADVRAQPRPGRPAVRRGTVASARGGPPLEALINEEDVPTPIREEPGVTQLNLLAASIEIPGRISIESGAAPLRLLASHVDFEGALEHHAAPRRSSSVFLAARFRNTSTFPLLAGPVALFVGPDYVGTTSIAQTAIEDEVLLPFGVDTGVTIDRTLAARTTTRAGARVRTTVRWEFRLNNRRDRPVDVTVLDQLPVSHSAGLRCDRDRTAEASMTCYMT